MAGTSGRRGLTRVDDVGLDFVGARVRRDGAEQPDEAVPEALDALLELRRVLQEVERRSSGKGQVLRGLHPLSDRPDGLIDLCWELHAPSKP